MHMLCKPGASKAMAEPKQGGTVEPGLVAWISPPNLSLVASQGRNLAPSPKAKCTQSSLSAQVPLVVPPSPQSTLAMCPPCISQCVDQSSAGIEGLLLPLAFQFLVEQLWDEVALCGGKPFPMESCGVGASVLCLHQWRSEPECSPARFTSRGPPPVLPEQAPWRQLGAA